MVISHLNDYFERNNEPILKDKIPFFKRKWVKVFLGFWMVLIVISHLLVWMGFEL
mgnify:CR=1 FL=1